MRYRGRHLNRSPLCPLKFDCRHLQMRIVQPPSPCRQQGDSADAAVRRAVGRRAPSRAKESLDPSGSEFAGKSDVRNSDDYAVVFEGRNVFTQQCKL